MTTDEKRRKLAERDLEILSDRDLFDVFLEGCAGYNNMDEELIDEIYDEFIELTKDEEVEEKKKGRK